MELMSYPCILFLNPWLDSNFGSPFLMSTCCTQSSKAIAVKWRDLESEMKPVLDLVRTDLGNVGGGECEWRV